MSFSAGDKALKSQIDSLFTLLSKLNMQNLLQAELSCSKERFCFVPHVNSDWKGRMFFGHVGKAVGNVIYLLHPVAWANKELQESRLSNFLTSG